MKKTVRAIILSILSVILLSFSSVDAATTTSPSLYSDKAVTIIADTGELVYSKKSTVPDFPASTTKILTALLMLEKLKPTDRITMTSKSVKEERNNDEIILKKGESMKRDVALKILIINSNNNLAYAIAEKISGSVPEFAKLMNKRAKELGAKNSNFVNASGLPNNKHKTTAYDLAMITRVALKQPLLVKAMSTTKTTVKTSRQKATLTKTNAIFSNPNFLAAKTGFTNAAKNTLIEATRKNNITLIHVVLRSSKKNYPKDIEKLDAYAYSKVRKLTFVDRSNYKPTITILDKQIETRAMSNLTLITALPESDFTIKVVPNNFDEQTLIEKGILPKQVVGHTEVYQKNKKIKDTTLVSAYNYTFAPVDTSTASNDYDTSH
ncbi:D-alanyl-D-alanine carboxypeptidase family protein [Gottfriedia acidiceleris]|uniref:D-alanyl-D-alanine carboxypeptidase family protein n=1 Tax=Gottfriedia acidiceleris TaxID=371036 RepID=UPI00101D1191|nr:D-alanyl-D-alanine carboxypeptidase [Gottfriedia acidiceleris]